MQEDKTTPITIPMRLKLDAVAALMIGVGGWAAGFWAVTGVWGADAWRWAAPALLLVIYQFFHLVRNLDLNTPVDAPGEVFATLGAANWITLLRAQMLALLVGFVFASPAEGWLRWAPGGLYLAAALLDFADGAAARLSGRSTRLGAILDMQWDGVGVLAGAMLLVLSGETPAWFVLVGLARYLFIFGMSFRARRGWPTFDLPPDPARRALAGVMMGFIAVALLPVFGPPITTVATYLFSLPFLVGFTRDWLVVSGALAPPRRRVGLPQAIPLLIRLAVTGVLVWMLVDQVSTHFPQPALAAVAGIAALSVLLGAAGRATAIVAMLSAGLALQSLSADVRLWAVLCGSILLFFTGTGPLSLWKPEEWLIEHRVGDPR